MEKVVKEDGTPYTFTTQDEWAVAAALDVATVKVDTNFSQELTTGTDGKATLATSVEGTAPAGTTVNPDFTVGLYRVTEIAKQGFTAADPFLVALPYADNETGAWSYQQTVKPKNQNIVPSKQVDDTGATIGSTLTYTVNAPVPAGTLTRFNVLDPLNAALSLDTANVTVAVQPEAAVTLAAEDYNVTVGDVTINGVATPNTLKVEFTESGLAKLQEARTTNPDLKVVVTLKPTLTALPEGGELTNTATVEVPGATVDTDGDDPSTTDVTENNPTKTTFGTLTITKTTSNGDKPLDGAVFELYQCEDSNDDKKYELLGEALQVHTTGTAEGQTATSLTTAGGTTAAPFTSSVQGFAIPLESFAAETGTVVNDYCVLETKAPAGYVPSPEPQKVEVDLAAKELTVSVDNQKNSLIGQLPDTGRQSLVLILLLGLVALGIGLYRYRRDEE